ncbi:stage IV sporulation protein FB [Bacillus sp. FJAT-18017]|uniref:M50 family metallopeptidase n=1 Tax=Bacillus sp. FJAT-18017 TaxID=1705566 RepID=UPI0006B01FDE|nr:M50 family metallopeptidase [Bacillus sp. FJAT-18017]ALC89802.1 stage IV sporulation protein FB [Bacillus sp. FJAT-18017]
MNKAASLLGLVHIHPLLWLAAALAVVTAHFQELCMLLFIIFIHEIGHAFAAAMFSWRIKRITLLPFGGVAEMDEHGNRPLKEETIVILAGPVQHVWMIAAAYILHSSGLILDSTFELFLEYNMMILVFNLLPIWPLDGGKLLFLGLSLWKPFPEAHRWALIASFAALIVFTLGILVIAPLHLNSWIIAGFLYFTLFFEWKQRHYVFMRFLLERYYGKKDSNLSGLQLIKANEGEPILEVLAKFRRGFKHSIVIDSAAGEKGILDENEVLHACFSEHRISGKIGDLFFVY